jgi:hypothetical protein
MSEIVKLRMSVIGKSMSGLHKPAGRRRQRIRPIDNERPGT